MPRQVMRDNPRLERVYDCIVRYKRENDGCSPAIREIGRYCRISSTSVVRYYLAQLEQTGRIVMPEGSTRSIMVVGGKWEKEE